MLRSILITRKKYLGEQHMASGEVSYALGILQQVLGEDHEAKELYDEALKIYQIQLGDDHESTQAIKSAIEVVTLEEAGVIQVSPIPSQQLVDATS